MTTINEILHLAAFAHGVTVGGLRGRSQLRKLTVARVNVYRAMRAEGRPFREIGALFNRAASTVRTTLARHDGWQS